jgi:hypothetical protein
MFDQSHPERAVRRHVTGRDVVGHHDQHPSFDPLGQRRHGRRRDDVAALLELDGPAVRRRVHDLAVVDRGVRLRRHELGRLAEIARVGDLTLERCGGGRGRGGEVDAVVPSAAPPREVAVERAHGDRSGGRCLADADARAARGLEDAGARAQQIRVDAAADEHVENLP